MREPVPQLLSELERGYLLAGFKSLQPSGGGLEPRLRATLEDVLRHPGSLIRAQLAYGITRREGFAPERARAVAIAVEYFHTASLVFDDLPMMDRASERRGRPCPHHVFGEAQAILAALALINRGYGLLWGVLSELPSGRREAAGRLVTEALGAAGILDGQARDLEFAPAGAGEAELLAVAEAKTAPLIRLTLELPAVIGGIDEGSRRLLARLSAVWGRSYQLLDDWADSALVAPAAPAPDADAVLGRPNLVNELGPERALELLAALLGEASELLAEFRRRRGVWQELEVLQGVLVRKRREALAAADRLAAPVEMPAPWCRQVPAA